MGGVVFNLGKHSKVPPYLRLSNVKRGNHNSYDSIITYIIHFVKVM